MYLMYADESGNTGMDLDNKQQPIFVLAGVLVQDKKWHEINNYFNLEKIKIWDLFETNEIHTADIFSPRRKSAFRQDNWIKNIKILEQLVNLILELDISVMYIAIDKKQFKKSIQSSLNAPLKINPYLYSFTNLYNDISKKLCNEKNNGLIFLDDILTIPSQLHNIYPSLSKNNQTMIEEAIFVKSNYSNFIQIADVFAFYIEKYFSLKKGYKQYSEIKNTHCFEMYTKLSKKFLTSNKFLTTYSPN